MTRTETDVLTQAPVEFTLGGNAWTISPLPLGKAVAFQQRAWKLLGSLKELKQINLFAAGDDGNWNVEALQSLLGELIGEHGEDIASLFYEYCQWDNELIDRMKENANLPDFIVAVSKVAPLAFPLSQIMARLGVKPDLNKTPENGTAKAPVPKTALV